MLEKHHLTKKNTNQCKNKVAQASYATISAWNSSNMMFSCNKRKASKRTKTSNKCIMLPLINILLLQLCINEANMQTLVWTLVGRLCSSFALLVCCPGLVLPLRHPRHPETKCTRHNHRHGAKILNSISNFAKSPPLYWKWLAGPFITKLEDQCHSRGRKNWRGPRYTKSSLFTTTWVFDKVKGARNISGSAGCPASG